jgi:RecB family exonuclease
MAYSFSQIGVYQSCQLKYQYQYIDKIKLAAREETADLVLGSLVHETLERLYKQVNNLTIPTLEATIKYYQQLRDQRLQTIEQSPIITKGDNQLEDYIRRGHHYIRQYYQQFAPFDQSKIISVEQQQILEITPGVKFRGIIDRVDLAGDMLMIHDYKTNKHLPPNDDTHHIEQLTLYAAIVREQYGKYASKIV